MTNKEVKYTDSIPVCPFCDKPTSRTFAGSQSTLMMGSTTYDENGFSTYYDPNTYYDTYICNQCKKQYTVSMGRNESPKYTNN